jgi:hypothetical protein
MGRIVVKCNFSDGWVAVVPADVFDAGNSTIMQTLIGWAEGASWLQPTDPLRPYAARRCAREGTSFSERPGAYMIAVGWSGTYSGVDYQNNGWVRQVRVEAGQVIEKTLEMIDMDRAWDCISCPWLYVWDGTGFVRRTEIIADLFGPDLEATQRTDVGSVIVQNGVAVVRISEEKQETSYLDAIWLEIVGTTALPDVPALAAVDGERVTLGTGQYLDVTFRTDLPDGQYPAAVAATGYYVPAVPLW